MKKFLASVGIVDFLFIMALTGVKRVNDLAFNVELYPWILGAAIALLIVILLYEVFGK